MVNSIHLDSSSQLYIGPRIFIDFILEINGTMLSMVGNMSIDSDALFVASSVL